MVTRLLLSALRKAMDYRFDGQPQLYYLDETDFGLNAEPFSFRSGKWLLRGKKYSQAGQKPSMLCVFFHGAGAGHSAYMLEIAALVKQGYLVYAYDNTGCMTSEGRSVGSLAQSLVDQEAFFAYLETQPEKDLPRVAVGHSWGGFTALGALKKAYHVSKIVSISGFFCVADEVVRLAPKFKKFEGAIRKAMDKGYGKYGSGSLLDEIESSDAEILYIQGEADNLITKDTHYDVLMKRFGNHPRVHTMLVEGAMHNPYWTLESQKYSVTITKKWRIMQRDYNNHAVIDYGLLYCDEPKVMNAIFDFLRA
ncbi:MAG: alpha/beta hydrolase [Bacilli bacterium]|nr:alpha/beta hydrolase [Bacilli bacterium]